MTKKIEAKSEKPKSHPIPVKKGKRPPPSGKPPKPTPPPPRKK